MDILEKALYHEDDLLIPLPKARTIPKVDSQPTEPPPQPQDKNLTTAEQLQDSGTSSVDQGSSEAATTAPKGLIMKVSPLLDVDIVVPLSDVIGQVMLSIAATNKHHKRTITKLPILQINVKGVAERAFRFRKAKNR